MGQRTLLIPQHEINEISTDSTELFLPHIYLGDEHKPVNSLHTADDEAKVSDRALFHPSGLTVSLLGHILIHTH